MQINLPQPSIRNVLSALIAGLIILLVITGIERGELFAEVRAIMRYPLGWIETGRRWQAWLAGSAIVWLVAAWR